MPKMDQGVSNDRYCVIPRVLIFIFRGNDVLLLKGKPTKKIWPNRYNGIGGHVERGEDMLTAARRELKEEAAIQIDKLVFCGSVMVDAGDERGIVIFIFKGEYWEKTINESGEGSLEWVRMDQIMDYPLVEDLPLILPIIHRMNKDSQPLTLLYEYDDQENLRIRFGE